MQPVAEDYKRARALVPTQLQPMAALSARALALSPSPVTTKDVQVKTAGVSRVCPLHLI